MLMCSLAALALPALIAPPEQVVHFTYLPTGGQARLGGTLSRFATLSDTKPDLIKKVPAGLSSKALYGELKIAGPHPASFAIIIDEPEGQPPKLYVDANGNGDLTDDPTTTWTGSKAGPYLGDGVVILKTGGPDHPRDQGVRIAWSNPAYPPDVQFSPQMVNEVRHRIAYGPDSYMSGTITLDGHDYAVALADPAMTGSCVPIGEDSMVLFAIDANGDGAFAFAEDFHADQPVKFNGHVYELKDIAADGSSLRLVPSDKVAYSRLDVAVGQTTPAFVAKTMDGKEVAFPTSYNGKVVLLDFWATWCAPCRQEVPVIVTAYEKHHAQGFEILSVSLDGEAFRQQVKTFTAQKKMAWLELLGPAGNVPTVQAMYCVEGIPSAFLVDGTTGKILAAGDELRGDGLERALEKALAAKSSN